MDKFEPHGFFEISINGNILVASFDGAWNEETAMAFSQEFKSKVAQIQHSSWGHLALLEKFEGAIPAADEILKELVDWCVLNQLRAAAHVYNESAYKEYYINKVVSDNPSYFSKSAFRDIQEAIVWLNHQGYILERPKLNLNF